jgi:hypothetical protein
MPKHKVAFLLCCARRARLSALFNRSISMGTWLSSASLSCRRRRGRVFVSGVEFKEAAAEEAPLNEPAALLAGDFGTKQTRCDTKQQQKHTHEFVKRCQNSYAQQNWTTACFQNIIFYYTS